jgi:VanZ family protein
MHFFAYGGLAGLAAWAFSQKKELTPPQLFAVWGIVSTYGIVDELLQLIPAMNRSADVMDWLADTAGAACAVILFALFARLQRAMRGQVTVF